MHGAIRVPPLLVPVHPIEVVTTAVRRRPPTFRRQLDVQVSGEGSAQGLGFGGIESVRAGKLIELELADATSDADIEAMCRKLLANTVIENFRIERGEAVA